MSPPVAGFSARMLVAVFVAPLELVRTKMQAAVTKKARSATMLTGLRMVVEADGVRGLWRGLAATIARDAPFSAVYWALFEQSKAYLSNGGPDDMVRSPTIPQTLAASACSGVVATVVTNPADVLKTRLQAAPVGSSVSLRGELAHIVRVSGGRGLLTGLPLRLARIVPATALFMTSYEVIRRWW